ncbi:hypothetical protein [Bacillus aerolatus]|nr:hypothetical protein [Bacillus aerolatus]
MMRKKEELNHREEYGAEFGDVNASKYYEIRAGETENKQKKEKKSDTKC